MKPELMLLIWAAVLTLVQGVVAAQGAFNRVGLFVLAGNREAMPEITGWGGRAARAHRNMLENLVLFVILVVVAVLADKTNGTTLLGAQIFFWARVAYAVIYVAGIPWLRTGVWVLSLVGLGMILAQLI